MIAIAALILCAVLTYVYLNEKKKENYWRSKGVAQLKYVPFLGLLWKYAIVRGRSLGHVLKEVYHGYKDQPYVGCFTGSIRNLILISPNLFQHVMRTESKTFNSRGIVINRETDILADNVLFMEGIRWKLMRQRLTPVFTSGKLKNMFYIMNESGKDFRHFMEEIGELKRNDPMDIIATFTMTAISASVFGIEANPGKHFDSQLQRMAREANTPSFMSNVQFLISNVFPTLVSLLNLKVFSQYESFFVNLVKRMLKVRKESGVVRHDFVDNCLEIQKDEFLRDAATGYSMKTTDELMAGQAFFFFIAGIEPSATAMNFTLYELSKHPNILETLHREIDESLGDGRELTVEILESMQLLEKVLCEAMRMYPPIPYVQRMCSEDHVLPDGLKLEKGTIVTIPILGVHTDETYYPNPEVFDPERFSPEAIKERPHYVYLPFGEGNRICIGMRFAKLQVKTGLVHILRNYTVRSTATAAAEPLYVKSSFSLRSRQIQYTFVPRN